MWEQHKTQGNSHYAQDRFEEALQSYTKAIQLDPSQCVLYTNRALTNLKLQRVDAAMMDAEKAVTISRSSLKGYYVIGRCHSHRGQHDEAVRAFRRCLDMANETDPSGALYHEIFRYYFGSRKKFYTERRREHLEAVKAVADAAKQNDEGSPNDMKELLIGQLMEYYEGINHIGEEHGSVLRTSLSPSGSSQGKSKDFVSEVPDCFLCPISLEIMRDPVIVIGSEDPQKMCSNQSYERSSITKHFEKNGPVDPMGRFTYRPKPTLVSNLSLRTSIQFFLESHPWLFDEQV